MQYLKTAYEAQDFDSYVEFFQRHRNLSHLNLEVKWDIILVLDELTAELTNLTEMIVRGETAVRFETVVRFIESHPKLKKFQFPHEDILEDDTLRRRFETDWHIGTTIDDITQDDSVFLFERKENV